MTVVLTLGYVGWQPDALAAQVGGRGALLVDIRYQAWSRAPHWRPAALAALVGPDRYIAIRALGNINYRGGPILLANPDEGLTQLRSPIQAGQTIALLCGCRDHRACHRSLVADLVAQRFSLPVEHVYPATPSRAPDAPAPTVHMALTLQQPWATLVASGAKRIETRSWSTRYRGPLLIHAAKGFSARALCDQPAFAAALNDRPLPRGALVATADLQSIERITGQNAPAEPERSFGDYTPGRYAWYLSNVQSLPAPIPAQGALGLWRWHGELPAETSCC